MAPYPSATMTDPIPTVALISGGKDSFFSLIQSNSNGFKVIALANLHPPLPPTDNTEDASDDMNSFMYQTVGHNVLPHYAAILGIPLYRQPIAGKSLNQDLSYHPGSNENKDETEDLYELLVKVKDAHPEIRAVSSGAILSSYQRTRVESVCQRLGLISVAWLWQRRQELVLSEMDEIGLDARIIKVASLGLDERWLGRNVSDSKTRRMLDQVKAKWGGNVAGEGGEFETLVMGCRGWPKRIDVKNSSTVDEGDSVAWTRFLEIDVVEVADPGEITLPPKPPILEEEFDSILQNLKSSQGESHGEALIDMKPSNRFQESIQVSPRNLFITNLSSTTSGLVSQSREIFDRLDSLLQQNCSNKKQVTSTLLLLRSMSDFLQINKPYSTYFSGFPNPPSRVCVAIGDAMPQGIDILLSVVADMLAKNDIRKALHVQSRSYWAPANVGPYSQAIAVEGVVSIAGMIGLVPETMKVWNEEGVQGETVLALQSLVRVGREVGIHGKEGWLGGVGFVVDSTSVPFMQKAWAGWFGSKNSDEDDVLDEDEEELEDRFSKFPFFEKSDEDITPPVHTRDRPTITPRLLIVQVPELPIQSNVEFACLGVDSAFLKSRIVMEEAENLEDFDPHNSIWQLDTMAYDSADSGLNHYSVKFGYHAFVWGALSIEGSGIVNEICKLRRGGYEYVSLTIYLAPNIWERSTSIMNEFSEAGCQGVCIVPVHGVWWGDEPGSKTIGFAARFRKTES